MSGDPLGDSHLSISISTLHLPAALACDDTRLFHLETHPGLDRARNLARILYEYRFGSLTSYLDTVACTLTPQGSRALRLRWSWRPFFVPVLCPVFRIVFGEIDSRFPHRSHKMEVCSFFLCN